MGTDEAQVAAGTEQYSVPLILQTAQIQRDIGVQTADIKKCKKRHKIT